MSAQSAKMSSLQGLSIFSPNMQTYSETFWGRREENVTDYGRKEFITKSIENDVGLDIASIID